MKKNLKKELKNSAFQKLIKYNRNNYQDKLDLVIFKTKMKID